tara:strand:- start:8041 stop:8214 length:174 start_codon:yes stop_codon:yes gene_type:complete
MTKFTVYYTTNNPNPTKRCTSVERRRTLKARSAEEAVQRVLHANNDIHARGFYAVAS